jgi:PAS domain S-box-containing protein
MTRRSRSIRRSSLDQRSAVVKEEVTEQVRAHQKLESLTAQLTSELSAMTRMQQVSARLGRAGDFSTLLHDIIDAAIEITRADMGAIQLLEDGALKIVAQRGFEAPFLDFFNMTREGQAACGAAIQKGERVIVEDVANSHIFAGAPALDVMLAAGARAVQYTPLVSRSGHVLGMFSTHYRAPSRASEHELRQLDVLARQAADFIERNQAEQALQENERRFREMLDALPAAIYTTDAEGRLTYFNPAAVELSGRTPELGTDQWRVSWKLYYPDGAPMPHGECPMAVAIKEGRAVRGAEAVAERPDGKRIWFEPYPTPLRDGEGWVVGGINMLLDVTERKRAEEALRHCSEKYETLLNQAPIGVYLVDADFRIRNVNPTALQVFGDIPDLIGRDFDEVIHLLWTKEYADEIVRLFRHTLETGESYETPERAERRIDRDVTEYYEWRIDRIEMPDDGYGVVCYFRDISSQAQARKALAESEERYRSLFDLVPVCVYACDSDGLIREYNQRAVDLWGRAPEKNSPEEKFCGSFKLFYPDGRFMPHEESPMSRALSGETLEADALEAIVERPDGLRKNVIAQPRALLNERGEIIGAINCLYDITERKLAEAAAAQLAAIVETSDDAIVSKDLNGIIASWNNGAERLFGYTAAEVIGKPVTILIPLERADEESYILERIRRGERVDHYETVRRRKDGSEVDISLTVSPIRDRSGKVVGASKIARDITERKRAEEVLRASEAWLAGQREALEAALNGAPLEISLGALARAATGRLGQGVRAAFYLADPEGRELRHVVGMPAAYAEAVDGFKIGPESLSCGLATHTGLPVLTGDVTREPLWAPWLWLAEKFDFRGCWSFPVHTEAEKFVGTFAVYWRQPREATPEDQEFATLVTQAAGIVIGRDRAARALRESEERFRNLADNAPVMVWMTEPGAGCVYLSKSWYEFTGQTPETGLGFGWLDATHPDDREYVRETFLAANSKREAFRLEYRLRRKDGEYRWAIDAAAPRFDPGGEFLGHVGSVIDITERKQMEAERERMLAEEQSAREMAEQATRAKDDFLGVVSHELRSPLNAILGWSGLLRSQRGDDPRIAKAVETIERSGKSQLQLIEDLLDTTRIVTGKMKLEFTPVELAPVISSALDTVRPAADNKGITITMSLDSEAGQITGDPDRLRQVVWNLASNAIKFTPEGGHVWVELRRGDAGVQIVVRDTGPGIAPDLLPYVFDRFKQGDSATSRRFGGLGLGLALVKHLVELHGGGVAVESPGEGLGATFTVNLPMSAVKGDSESDGQRDGETAVDWRARRSKRTARLDGVRALVVDDEAGARELLTITLELHGVLVECADSAEAAISAIESRLGESGAEPFDVLISDVGMPGVDGYELIRRVRAHPDERVSRIRAVALTAYARSEDRLRALQAGFYMQVSKPVDEEELTTVIAALMGGQLR